MHADGSGVIAADVGNIEMFNCFVKPTRAARSLLGGDIGLAVRASCEQFSVRSSGLRVGVRGDPLPLVIIQELHFDLWMPIVGANGDISSPIHPGAWHESQHTVLGRSAELRRHHNATFDLSPIAGDLDSPPHRGVDDIGGVDESFSGAAVHHEAAMMRVRTWVSGIDISIMEFHGPLLRAVWAE